MWRVDACIYRGQSLRAHIQVFATQCGYDEAHVWEVVVRLWEKHAQLGLPTPYGPVRDICIPFMRQRVLTHLDYASQLFEQRFTTHTLTIPFDLWRKGPHVDG